MASIPVCIIMFRFCWSFAEIEATTLPVRMMTAGCMVPALWRSQCHHLHVQPWCRWCQRSLQQQQLQSYLSTQAFYGHLPQWHWQHRERAETLRRWKADAWGMGCFLGELRVLVSCLQHGFSSVTRARFVGLPGMPHNDNVQPISACWAYFFENISAHNAAYRCLQ